jgi:glycosyltransferase involved in cell wall biosynthesis
MGAARDHVVVVPNGIELTPFERAPHQLDARLALGAAPCAHIVVGIGRLSPEKGFDRLIEAFTNLAECDATARLYIAGTGPQEATYREMASRINHHLGGEPRIVLMGHCHDVVPLLAAADVVAIPSREEGQGIVAIEAMASSRPVIAMRVGGVPETVIDGETGFLVTDGDMPTFMQKLDALLNDATLRARLGQAGRDRVHARFRADTMVDRTVDIYRQIASGSQGVHSGG